MDGDGDGDADVELLLLHSWDIGWFDAFGRWLINNTPYPHCLL